MNYRNEFQNARENGHWSKAERLFNELILASGIEDEEYDKMQREKGEQVAEMMNKRDELARNFGKTI